MSIAMIVGMVADMGIDSIVCNAAKPFMSSIKRHPIRGTCEFVGITFLGIMLGKRVGKFAEEETAELIEKFKNIEAELVKHEESKSTEEVD